MKCLLDCLVSFHCFACRHRLIDNNNEVNLRPKRQAKQHTFDSFYNTFIQYSYYITCQFASLSTFFNVFLFQGGQEESRCLLSEDIPGSNLDLTCLSSYRVDELKFWLSCRGDSLKYIPAKAACIQRYIIIYS